MPLWNVGVEPMTTWSSFGFSPFQEQGEMMKVDIPTPLGGLSLDEAEMQRTTKRPRMSGFKATRRGVETIKNIRERELHRLEAMVGVPFTLGPWATST